MGLLDRFRRRAPETVEPHIEFVCEQDGPPERELKSTLIPELSRFGGVRSAYLVRVSYCGGGPDSVALALVAPEDPGLVERLGAVFSSQFGSGEHLDMLFLEPERESEVQTVATPFYSAAAG